MNNNKFICEECFKSHNKTSGLIEVAACADSNVGYGQCCVKKICIQSCEFKCVLCSKISNNATDMKKIYPSSILNELKLTRDQIFVCNHCEMTLEFKNKYQNSAPHPAKIWYGISSNEWLGRYG